MAGGAAHELNNPLAVISGRAQLLSQAETDPDKKRMLKQIQDNASEITRIVEDLLAFAQPPQPKRTRTQVRQMLDEAVQLAAMKAKVDELDVAMDIAPSASEVYVDSAQIASAVANVLCNSVESYPDKKGPIKISVQEDITDDFIKLEITDSGSGMDDETLRKGYPAVLQQPSRRPRPRHGPRPYPATSRTQRRNPPNRKPTLRRHHRHNPITLQTILMVLFLILSSVFCLLIVFFGYTICDIRRTNTSRLQRNISKPMLTTMSRQIRMFFSLKPAILGKGGTYGRESNVNVL